MDVGNIIKAIQSRKIRITDHADEEAHDEGISYDETFLSVHNGEIIENYPTDRPYPSCLIFGRNFQEQPVHSVWAYNEDNGWAVLITVYRPDPKRWMDYKTRRNDNDSLQ